MDAFILGSGPSLLNLTDEEKSFLNDHPYTLAMNRYLLFWEQVGVLPKDLFLADTGTIPTFILAETLRRARSSRPDATYYIHRSLAWRYFGQSWRTRLGGVKRRLRFFARHRCWIPLRGVKTVAFDLRKDQPAEAIERDWAKDLTEPLFHYRGSLTTAIHLASLIYPVDCIKLLGVDLTSYSLFFGKSFEALISGYRVPQPRAARLLRHHDQARERGVHATALTFEGKPGVTAIIPRIRERLRNDGIDLVCCNEESALVTEGCCPYAPPMRDEIASVESSP